MGTTAQKGAYLNQTKLLLKDKINALGGSIDDETTFREYANQLDGIYEALPKTEFEEGESVTLENTLKGKLDFDDGKVGYGQSSQESTQGYNLYYIDKNDYQQNWNNIDFTLTRTGYKVYSANSQASTGFTIVSRKITLPAGIYTFVLKHASALRVAFSNTSYAVLGIIEIGGTYSSFSINDETDVALTLLPANGASYNEENEIMLYSGNYDSSKTFEDYSGGYASPSPNWEQEVKCVRGKNRFNNTIEQGTLNSGGGDTASTTRVRTNGYVQLDKNTYTISIVGADQMGAYLFDSQKQLLSATGWQTLPATITLSQNGYIRFAIRKSNDSTLVPSDISNVQIEEGTTSTPYLPYNTIEEVVSDNILDLSTLYLHPNNNLRVINNDNELEIKPNTTITIKANAGYNYGYFELDANKQTLVDSGWKDFVTTFTSNSSAKYLRLNLRKSDNGVISNLEEFIEGMGLEIQYSSTYITPKTYQFSLGNHKFYGIGDYRDYIGRSTGKNKINPNQYLHAVVNATIGSTGTLSEWATSWTTWFEMKPNQTYVFSGNLSNVNSNVVRAFVTNSEVAIGTSVTRVDNLQNGGTYTNTSGYKYLVLEFLDGTTYGGNWQIEEGSIASDYEPYGVGVWYKYEKIGEKIFTGASDENWSNGDYGTNSYKVAVNDIQRSTTSVVDFTLCLSNLFRGIPYNNRTGSGDNVTYSDVDFLGIYVRNTSYSSLVDFKTMLSNRNMKTIYVKSYPAIDIITGTLAEQLEAWWNGQSLDGTTIIEGNGDLPMLINVRALKGAA